MAFFPEVSTASTPSAAATMPQVYVNGRLQRQIICTACESRTGIVPAEARLQIHAEDLTIQGPITLRALSIADQMVYGARVKVSHGDDVYFLGTLLPKSDQGSNDGVSWKALDDRWILSRLPIRGALVNDGGFIKFLSRYTPEMNPDGRWNCMGAMYDGRAWPVFSPMAEKAKGFQATEENFPATLDENVLGPWTPRRALQYLYLLTHCERDGFNPSVKGYRTLRDSVRIDWTDDAADLISGDTGDGDGDQLDKKIPNVLLKGSVLNALNQVLRCAGTHDLQMQLVGDKSKLVFVNSVTCPEAPIDIPVIRGGTPDDINTAFDFDLDEDPSDIAESVLVEGAPVHAEAQFEYDPNESNNTIKPAWSTAREGYFCKCIWGAAEGADKGEWAMVPATAGAEPTLPCNGTDRPAVPSCSAEAVQLARRLYPDVFVEFVVDSTKAHDAGILKGLSADGSATDPKYENTIEYPFYSGARPIGPSQLQHFLNGSDTLPTRMPIRVQVKSGGEWLDTPYADGLRIGPASFALFGLAEPAEGQSYCIYEGSLIDAPFDVTMRAIRVNCAVSLDHRVRGYAELENDERLLDASLLTEFGGPIMDYAGDGEFREDYQFKSKPSAEPPANTGQTDYDANGQTGYLPPGSEQPQADAAASRLLQQRRYVKRRSSWRLVGIRPDFYAGLWVGNAKMVNGQAGDRDFKLLAPIKTVAYDFLGQTTHVGGLVATVQVDRDPAAAVSTAEPGAGAIDDSTARRPAAVAGDAMMA